MHGIIQDIAYFRRTVAKSPAFFAVAVLALALGTGANTAMFSVINSVLLRPLPFRDPDRLVRLFETEAAPGKYPFAGPDYIDWRAQNHTLESTALFTYYRRSNVSGGSQADSALSVSAEPTFFDVLGVQPLLGRTFSRAEGTADGRRVAILSYGFWQRRFGGDRAIVNRSIDLDAERYTVVGIMPSWFNYPKETEIWVPLDMSAQRLGSRGSHSFLAIARLKPGATVSQAQADLSVIARRLEQQHPRSNEKVGAAVVSMKEQLTGASREPLLILLGAVGLVLLVACANVANLLLIRSNGRRRELAVRTALGAGRWRVVRQLLTESLLLALTGSAAGLGVAWCAVKVLQSARSLPIPLVNPVRIDPVVLLFTLAIAILTGLVFGILPALHGSDADLSEDLKSSSRAVSGTGSRARRLRDVIAVAEIAVSLALLVGAGLLLRTFDRMRHAEIGVDARNVLTASLDLPGVSYRTPTARRAFFDQLLARVRSSPGVQAVSLSTQIPLEGGSNGYITVPGRDDPGLRNQLFEWNCVTADYFRAFGIPLLQGRGFIPRDEDQAEEVSLAVTRAFSSPSPNLEALRGLAGRAVINRSMARLVWPGQDPVGKTFVMGGVVTMEVIGVVGDVRVRGIRSEALPQAYLPLAASLDGRSVTGQLAVRTAVPPLTLLPAVRAHLNALDPALAVIEPRTMAAVISDGMADTSLQASLLGAFAALAAVLAGIGLYSVMAFLVAQRRHELGIRIALGAGHADLLRLVLSHAAKLVVAGVLAGLAAAWSLTRLIRGLLFGVAANDLATFAAVAGLLALIALAACAIPARRATRVDPMVALRYE